ncbi:MAG TPA: sulfite exporter TauE/SafE family protein [Streptosporangiaceae bacterium]|nr:sulfite exporter TauE/SafE family protein [Streptosporangiaceae bacterium]
MGIAEALGIFAAGIGAGTINAVVGSGSLITFPTLLAFGFPPVTANVSNNIGLVPGNFSGAWGYRRELSGQRRRLLWLGMFSALGSIAGAIMLLALPAGAFKLIVSGLILISCVLVLLQPRLSARIAARRERDGQGGTGNDRGGPVLAAGVFGSGIYGGYFGAAQGVLVIGLLGSFLDESMQRINGAKNVLVGIVNGVAAVIYIIFASVSWPAVLLVAAGSTIGGLLGARIGRRLPPLVLRVIVVVIGIIAVVKLLFF